MQSEYWWFQNPQGERFILSRIDTESGNWFKMADEMPMTEDELEARGCVRLVRVSEPVFKELRLYSRGRVTTVVDDNEDVRLVGVTATWTALLLTPESEFQLTINVNRGECIRQLTLRVNERREIMLKVPQRAQVTVVTVDSEGVPLPAELTLLYCAAPLDDVP